MRIPVGTFAVLLLLIAAFPPDRSNGWQFLGSRHFHRPDWALVGLESLAALAITLGVWALFAGEGEK